MANAPVEASYNITINTDGTFSGGSVLLDSSGNYSINAGPGSQITFAAPSGWTIASYQQSSTNRSDEFTIATVPDGSSSVTISVGVSSSTYSQWISLQVTDKNGNTDGTPKLTVNVGPVTWVRATYSTKGQPGITYDGDITPATTTTPPTITLAGAGFVAITLSGATFDTYPVQWDDKTPPDHPSWVDPFIENSSQAVFYDDDSSRPNSYHFVLRYTLPGDSTVYTSNDPTIVNKGTPPST